MEQVSLLGIAALTFLSAAVQHGFTVHARGIGFVLTDRSQPPESAGFAGRAERTLRNTIESAAMFVPAMTLLLLNDWQGPVSAFLAGLYLLARTGFCLAYWGGLNRLRSVMWGTGMASIAVLYLVLLGQM